MIRSFLCSLCSAFKTRRGLALENLALRQQLAVLHRSVKRPRLSDVDRGFWMLLRRIWTDWGKVIVIVKPEKEGTLSALKPKRRGRKVQEVNPLAGRVTELEREVQRLQGKLRQAETIIDVQKKLCEMVGVPVSRLEKRSEE